MSDPRIYQRAAVYHSWEAMDRFDEEAALFEFGESTYDKENDDADSDSQAD